MSNFSNRLKQYGALSASILVAGAKVAKSQIVYTDLMPDVIVGSDGTISIDLDQDLINDLDLDQYYFSYYYYGTTFTYNSVSSSNHANADLVAFGSFTTRADRMASGEMIGPASNYATSSFVTLGDNSSTSYDWSNGAPHTDDYLGVRLDKGTHSLYGWIRLDYDAGSTGFTVKDFAYNSQPNAPIMAGDNTMGMTAVDTTITMPENPAAATVLGSIKAYSSVSTPISFSIVSGNIGNAFTIDGVTGVLSVNDPVPLDFEVNPTFNLEVEATDGTYTDTALVTINLTDVAEAPEMDNQSFTLAENSPNGTSVGTLVATGESALTFSITAGNTGNTFAIDGATGELTVSDSTLLDFETTPSFMLTVEATDGTLATSATVTINLSDVVEGVGIAEQKNQISLEVFPNPSTANGPITVKLPDNKPATVRILDANGKLVDTFSTNRRKLVIDTKDWSKGVYFLNVSAENRFGSTRIIIN